MKECFGTTHKGEDATCYVLQNSNGMKAIITNYGATLVSLLVGDKKGNQRDVVLGYDDVLGYEAGNVFFGATVGRNANRIKGAMFELNEKQYKLAKNDNENNLHSGNDYYNKRIWGVEEADHQHIILTLFSPDGDQGYPGALDIKVTYILTEDNELKISYDALAQADTIVNLTNHSYFNLAGEASGDILEQQVWIDADAYTKAGADSIPTGEIVPVSNTPMDFRKEKAIGQDIEADYEAIAFGHGYDHNWVLNGQGSRRVASLYSKESGIRMEVRTDLPGMQFYTGNFISGELGKRKGTYESRYGVCFETQYFPDAVNQIPFLSPYVKGGETFQSETSYRFIG